MARYRTLKEWEALEGAEKLTAAENALIEACRNGILCRLGDGRRPEGADLSRNIRADLIRYLVLGGCEQCRVDENGIQLAGAFISGRLDLRFSRASGITYLVNCLFEETIEAMQASFELLNLSGSKTPGFSGQGIEISGGIFMNDGFISTGKVDFGGIATGGSVSCMNAQFHNPNSEALNLQQARIKGDIVFSRGFSAIGEVNLAGAKISGQLACSGGKFINPNGLALFAESLVVGSDALLRKGFLAVGEVSLSGARIQGQLACTNGSFIASGGQHSLNLQGIIINGDAFLSGDFRADGQILLSGAKIGGTLSFRGAQIRTMQNKAIDLTGAIISGQFLLKDLNIGTAALDLSSTHVGDVADNISFWPNGERVNLDGLTYERIHGGFTETDISKEWLKKGSYRDGKFLPQPYTQLAKVLREMGHDRSAREVMIAKEGLLAEEQINGDRNKAEALWKGDQTVRGDIGWHWIRRHLFRLWNWLLRTHVGYGFAPQNAVYLAFRWLVALTVFYWVVWRFGGLVPNSAIILTSPEWAAAMDADPVATGRLWAETAAGASHYETFWALFYATDVFVPLIDFGQEAAWTATTQNAVGWAAFVVTFIAKAYGWFITALGAAAVGGIIRRE